MLDTFRVPDTRFHKILQILSILLLAGQFLVLLILWNYLPDKIPNHFGADGQADSWRGKGFCLFLPILALLLYAMLTFMEHLPSAWNVPVKITKENSQWVYIQVKSMTILIKTLMLASFFYINLCSMLERNLGPWFLPVFLFLTFAPIVYYLVKISRCR